MKSPGPDTLSGFLFPAISEVLPIMPYIQKRDAGLISEPRLRKRLTLPEPPDHETTGGVRGEFSMRLRRNGGHGLRRRLFVISLYFVEILMMGAPAFSQQSHDRDGQPPASQNAVSSESDDFSLTDLVRGLRKERKLVGLAAMIMVDGQVVASAADGERKQGSGVQVEIDDRWHLGSITKSITATMIARLIESGRMQWSDTIGECFSDATIHEDWKPVTLRQLLTHTAGAPANFPALVALKRPAPGRECTVARREAVLEVLTKQPAHPPGEKCIYSNVGYTIAGAMAEKVTGDTWIDLVQREVFKPLELQGAGFGPPTSPQPALPQPRGHRVWLGWKFSVDDRADNTPIMGPAGTVHMTLRDLCTFATEHLRGESGTGKLLSARTCKRLHAPELDRYACGWVKNEPGAEIPHTIYWHNGSNTMWYAMVVFIPGKNLVVAVTSNDGDIAKAEAAAWEIVKAGVKQVDTTTAP